MRFSLRIISVLLGIVVMLVVAFKPLLVMGLQSVEVSDIAKKITVSIEGYNPGSGVIVGRNGNLYQVLTAWHVIQGKGKYNIRTYDNRLYTVNNDEIKRIFKVDIAVLEFESDQSYPLAKIGDSSSLKEGMTVFFAGYPAPGPLNLGRNYTFLTAKITTILSRGRNGYSLGYDNFAISGMSGGPVLNENGELVAIHGETEIRSLTGASGNYGVSSATFKNWQQEVTIASQRNILSDQPLSDGKVLSVFPPQFHLFVKYIWPTNGILKSGFGIRWGRMHKGIDIENSTGTPIYAAADGVVEKAGWNNSGYGNLVDIRHVDGSLTRYGHNRKILVLVGQQVHQGETIALMGSTGFSTGPHLHFEIHPSGIGAVDPIALLPQ